MAATQKKITPISQAVSKKLNQQMVENIKNNSCLGNSKRELKDLVQDLLQERCSGDADFAIVADQAFLMTSTVLRVANQDREEDYQPRADTLQRLLKVLDVRLVAEYQKIQKKYLPHTKRPDLEDV
ncbi:MAG: hypothetical protein GY714_01950 [Desulfobacterales bacterium]|nr:hypothetical protein [Desulfobacterales bacterium]